MLRTSLLVLIIGLFFSAGKSQESRGQQDHGIPLTTKKIEKIKMQGFYFGVNKTRDPRMRNLEYADRDAELISEFFTQNDLYESQPPVLLINEAVGIDTIFLLIDQFVKENQENKVDRVIIFYAAHGYTENGKTYLSTANSIIDGRWSTMIEINELYLEAIKPIIDSGVEVLLIIDACHSGSFLFEKMIAGSEQQGEVIELLSSGPREKSWEASKWNGGVFTCFLIKGMQGAASNHEDDFISVRELGRYVQDKVEAATYGRQTPEFSRRGKYKYLSLVESNEALAAEKINRDAKEVPFEEQTKLDKRNNSLTRTTGLTPSDYQTLKTPSGATKTRDTILRDKSQSDTIGLINKIEWFRNQLLIDPFTLPSDEELEEAQANVNEWLKFGLKESRVYKQIQEDSMVMRILKLFGKRDKWFKEKRISPLSTALNGLSDIASPLGLKHKSMQEERPSFPSLTKVDRSNIMFQLVLVNAYSDLGEDDLALAILDSVIVWNPDYYNFYLAKAWLHDQNDQETLALENVKVFEEKVAALKQLSMSNSDPDIDWLSIKQRGMIEKIKRDDSGNPSIDKDIITILPFTMSFEFDSSEVDYSRLVTEEVTASILDANRFNVIDASQFYAIVEERYNASEAFDESELIELGRRRGADYIIVGNISNISTPILISGAYGSEIDFILKIVSAETGHVLSTKVFKLSKGIRKLLGKNSKREAIYAAIENIDPLVKKYIDQVFPQEYPFYKVKTKTRKGLPKTISFRTNASSNFRQGQHLDVVFHNREKYSKIIGEVKIIDLKKKYITCKILKGKSAINQSIKNNPYLIFAQSKSD